MSTRLDRTRRVIPGALGVMTLAGVGALFAWDLFPGSFPSGAHDFLAAFPLAMIAVAYLVYQAARRPPALENYCPSRWESDSLCEHGALQ